MSIFEKILKLGLILISSVFHSKVWFFLSKQQQSKFFSTIFSAQYSLFLSPFHLVGLISTIISDSNRFSTQLARLIVFHLKSIQTPSDSDCRSSPCRCILRSPLRAGTKSLIACFFPLALPLSLFSPKPLKRKH
jgi:hypothetical protein